MGGKRLGTEVRPRAVALRRSGHSVPAIARELGIARSTAWLMTSTVPVQADDSGAASPAGTSPPARVTRRRAAIRRHQDKLRWARSVGDLSDRELLLVGAAMYWAEGSKDKPWRRDESLTFVNSDPTMIRVYLRWLDLMGVERERLTFRLQIHESADIAAALDYWSDLVDVEPSSFKPTTVKRHRPRTTRRNVGQAYRGCLCIRVLRASGEYRAAEGLWYGVVDALQRRAIGSHSVVVEQ
jgi:transposase-like protein